MKPDDLPFEQYQSSPDLSPEIRTDATNAVHMATVAVSATEPSKSSELHTATPSMTGDADVTDTQPSTISSRLLQHRKPRRLLGPPLILALVLTGAVLGLLAAGSFWGYGNGSIGNVGNAGGVGESLDVPNVGFEDGLSGWIEGFANGEEVKPNNGYLVGIDTNPPHEGKSSAFIKVDESTNSRDTFGYISRVIAADKARGKRVRYSAYVKTEVTGGGARLWMNVHGAVDGLRTEDTAPMSAGFMRGFNPFDSIEGTVDWARYEVVVDVPPEADYIAFGLNLGVVSDERGHGLAWLDDVRLEIVGDDVPTSDYGGQKRPENLDFEDELSSWNYPGERADYKPLTYQAGTSSQAAYQGNLGAYLKADNPAPDEVGVLWTHKINALYYRGKKLTVSAYINGDALKDKAKLYSHGSGGKRQLGNEITIMPSEGKGWQRYELPFDVPTTAEWFWFGVILDGAGELWIDDVKLSVR